MDNMLEHPWTELQLLIKEKWLTQKAFSSILWKKVSEVNELLKWKRNITIQRDYLLHQTLWTPIKYWILKQIDYDYSLIDIEETPHDDVILGDSEESTSQQTSHSEDLAEESTSQQTSHSEDLAEESTSQQTSHSEDLAEESIGDNTSFWTEWRIQENIEPIDSSADKSASEWQEKHQETPIKEPDSKDDEDLKNRAKIFRTF